MSESKFIPKIEFVQDGQTKYYDIRVDNIIVQRLRLEPYDLIKFEHMFTWEEICRRFANGTVCDTDLDIMLVAITYPEDVKQLIPEACQR